MEDNKKLKLIAVGATLLTIIAITLGALATANGHEAPNKKPSKTSVLGTQKQADPDVTTTVATTTAPAKAIVPVTTKQPVKQTPVKKEVVTTTTPTTLPKYVSFRSVTAKYVELPNNGLDTNFKPAVTIEMSDDREVYVHVIFAFARTTYIGGSTLETPVESIDKWVKISGTSTITIDWFLAPCDNMKYDVWIGEPYGYNENSLIDNKVARTYDTRLMWAPGTEGTCPPID